MTIEPLKCPGLAESRGSLVERVGLWIPLLGWCVGKLAWDVRVSPFVKQIKEQLEHRDQFPAAAWGQDECRLRFAYWLCVTVKEEIGWPNHHFHPEDPVRIAFWAYDDGLDINFLLEEIEDETGSTITKEDCETLKQMTLGQAVDFFLAKSRVSVS